MKKKHVFVTAGAMLLCCIAWMSSASTCVNSDAIKPRSSTSSMQVQPDSSVVKLMGAEVAEVLFSANKATLFRLNPQERPADGDRTMGGFKVDGTVKKLNAKEIYLFQYLLHDSLGFTPFPLVPSTPYAPTVALQLEGKRGVCCLLFSLTSQEIGIVYKGKEVVTTRYRYPRIITRWVAEQMNEQFYNDLLNLVK